MDAELRAVVIDDNVDAATSLSLLLDMLGCRSWVAHDFEAGIRQVHAVRPALVLLEMELPGMTGREVAQRLRAEPQHRQRLYVCLTRTGEPAPAEGNDPPAFDHVCAKPVSVTRLCYLLDRARARPRSA